LEQTDHDQLVGEPEDDRRHHDENRLMGLLSGDIPINGQTLFGISAKNAILRP
jgi:hypothetical protein